MNMSKRNRVSLGLAGIVVELAVISLNTPSMAAITFRDLSPAGSRKSRASAVDATRECGYVELNPGVPHAALWSSSASSFVDLNPLGAAFSACCGLKENEQVGWAAVEADPGVLGSTQPHAALWKGTAESFVDLHPNWAEKYGNSAALSTTGSRQFGTVHFTVGTNVGTLWTGTAGSGMKIASVFSRGQEPWTPVNLCPTNWDSHFVSGVSELHEVGWVLRGSTTPPPPGETISRVIHAARWSGTVGSFVDLHPASASGASTAGSRAHAAADPYQVGEVGARAALWAGSAESFVDLHTVLPSDFVHSVANAVWTDGTLTKVVGYATDSTSAEHAILWEITDFTVSPCAGKLVVRWPDASKRYVLQRATSLSPQDWTHVVEPPSWSNGISTVTVTATAAGVYFRLERR